MEFKLPEAVLQVMEIFEKNGFEAYVVGGSLRDLLLGKEPKDYDLATNARPEQIMKLFKKSWPVGIKHGTVLIEHDGMQMEVTTFRKESTYSDRRHPDEVIFIDEIGEDLARRDFTINAMAYSPRSGLIDPFGGKEDLEKGIIRAVGDADTRFKEDALRMMRAFRFAGKLGFEMDQATKAAIENQKDGIREIASERIADELQKIMAGSPKIIDQMVDLLEPVLPELRIMVECEQNNKHHYTDVLHHTLDALDYLKDHGYSDKRAWALLLHDVGKPASKTTNATGDHFNMHPQISTKMSREILKRFNLSKKLLQDVPQLILLHDAFYKPSLKNLYKLQVQYGMDDALIHDLFAVQKGDIDAHTSHDRLPGLEEFIAFYESEKNNHPKTPADLSVNGDDIKAIHGLEGKELGEYIKALHHQVFFNKDLEPRDVLLEYVRQHPTLRIEQKPKRKRR